MDPTAEGLLGKTRTSVLSALYLRADPSMYVRQIIRLTGGSPGAIQRELQHLESLHLVIREERGNQVHYRPNTNHPVHDELRRLLLKTTGIAAVLKAALEPLREVIASAFIYGSIASGEEASSSDVDVMVIGDIGLQELSEHLHKAESQLDREVNPTLYPPSEFREKVATGHHFLTSVLKGEKVLLIGREDDLTGLAGESLADRT